MSVKLLTEHHWEVLSIKGRYTGSSESTLVKISHCWKSHVTAHYYCPFIYFSFLHLQEEKESLFKDTRFVHFHCHYGHPKIPF